MTRIGVSRRKALEAGACALVGAAAFSVTARARARAEQSTTAEEIVRKWYKTWEVEKKDWGPFDVLLADNFTFSSAAGDDHISKSAFKTNCWDTQINFIGQFDLERVVALASQDAVRLVDELPDEQAVAVRGRVLDDRAYADLAVELDCSESVVRQRVSRGLARLRARLSDSRGGLT